MHSVDLSRNPQTKKDVTMKRISKPVVLLRHALIVCTIIVSTIDGVGSGVAADKHPKATLVYEHALPNVPRKSIKAVLVEYGPGDASSAHTHPKSTFNLRNCSSKEPSELRSIMGRWLFIAPDRTFPRRPAIGTLLMRMPARPNPPSCWPCSWSIRTRRNC